MYKVQCGLFLPGVCVWGGGGGGLSFHGCHHLPEGVMYVPVGQFERVHDLDAPRRVRQHTDHSVVSVHHTKPYRPCWCECSPHHGQAIQQKVSFKVHCHHVHTMSMYWLYWGDYLTIASSTVEDWGILTKLLYCLLHTVSCLIVRNWLVVSTKQQVSITCTYTYAVGVGGIDQYRDTTTYRYTAHPYYADVATVF